MPAALSALSMLVLASSDARSEEKADPKLGLQDIAEGFQAIERWHVDEARQIAERAYQEHPDYALTLALVGDVKMHMSDYAGAIDFYRRARDAGAPEQILATEPLAMATLKATDGYDEHVGEHFIARYTAGKDAILVPYVMETLEKARERIGGLLGWRPEGRVVVEIYPSASTLADVSTLTEAEIKASGTIALCRWNRLMVTSPRGVLFGYSWRDTMAHEMTHLIIGGASGQYGADLAPRRDREVRGDRVARRARRGSLGGAADRGARRSEEGKADPFREDAPLDGEAEEPGRDEPRVRGSVHLHRVLGGAQGLGWNAARAVDDGRRLIR
jgi:hypothetical protein